MAIALNTVIVDGQEYKPGDVIPDFKSIKCVDTREPKKYQGLSADVSVLNDVIAKYASGGASCFMSDTGEYYEYDRKEKTWKLITNITERGFGSEKAYGALKHMLKNVSVSDEKIKSAVTDYLTVNPVLPGATTEQAQQIEQNKTDVASLKAETGSLKEDIVSIQDKQGIIKKKCTINMVYNHAKYWIQGRQYDDLGKPTNISYNQKLIFDEKKNYVLLKFGDGIISAMYVDYYKADGTLLKSVYTENNTPFTNEAGAEYAYIRIYYSGGISVDSIGTLYQVVLCYAEDSPSQFIDRMCKYVLTGENISDISFESLSVETVEKLTKKSNDIFVSALSKHRNTFRILFISDMHFSDGSDNRFQMMVDDINNEHNRKPLDLVVVNGDMVSNTPTKNYFGNIMKYFNQIGIKVIYLKGNHDNMINSEWTEFFGNNQNLIISLDSLNLLCVDTFNGDLYTDSSGLYSYKESDISDELYNKCLQFINKQDTKKNIIVCHYPNTRTNISRLASNENVLCFFSGHVHDYDTRTVVGEKVYESGHYSYNITPEHPWGCRILESDGDLIYTYTLFFAHEYDNFSQERTEGEKAILCNTLDGVEVIEV